MSPVYSIVSDTKVAVLASVSIRYRSPPMVSKPVAYVLTIIRMPTIISKSLFILSHF